MTTSTTPPAKGLPPIKKANTSSETEAEEAAPEVKQPNKVLTEDMPQPPGVVSRRRRRVAKERRKGPFVKYVGQASLRVIRPTHWKSLVLNELKDDTATHTWSTKNDYLVEADQFSDEQLDYLLVDDLSKETGTHQFLEVDYDENGQLVQVPYEDEDSE